MAEPEEGEIVDSDTELEANQVATGEVPANGVYGVVQRSSMPSVAAYRTAARSVDTSSEEDDSDEEDSFLWNRKKIRYKAAVASGSDQPFRNPLRSNKMDRQTSESEASDTCMSPVKNHPPSFVEACKAPARHVPFGAKPKRRVNNVWGSVMTEQTLTSTMGGFDVNIPLEEKAECPVEDRNVENYDFTLKVQDNRPDPATYSDDNMADKQSDQEEAAQDICDKETFGKEDVKVKEERMKRKRKIGKPQSDNEWKERISAKERLGKRTLKERLGEKIPVILEKPEGYIDVTEEDTVEKVVCALVENLKEPKVKLMANVVEVLGKKNAIDLMHETEMIEAQGGMMTNDNARRRTPGGVFLQLLKFDCNLTSEQLKQVFGEERANEHKERKKRAAVYRLRKEEELKRRRGEADFMGSLAEYRTVKEQVKEDETVEKILNNEEMKIEGKDTEMRDRELVSYEFDDELGEIPDIEIG